MALEESIKEVNTYCVSWGVSVVVVSQQIHYLRSIRRSESLGDDDDGVEDGGDRPLVVCTLIRRRRGKRLETSCQLRSTKQKK